MISGADFGYAGFLLGWNIMVITLGYHMGKASVTRKRDKYGRFFKI